MPETIDLTKDSALAWVAGVLRTAKQIMEDEGSLAPMLFCMDASEKLYICPLVQVGGMDTEEGKDLIVAAMRVACRETKAVASAFVHDTWSTAIVDPSDEDWGAFLKAGKYANMPEELKRKVKRREAIMVSHEALDSPTRGLLQLYRRGPGNLITFEELIPHTSTLVGRFCNVLHRPKVESSEFLRRMREELAKVDDGEGFGVKFARTFREFGLPLGYALHVGATRIDILRPDGSGGTSIERDGNPSAFDELRAACAEFQEKTKP